jgi:hypothetical protein
MRSDSGAEIAAPIGLSDGAATDSKRVLGRCSTAVVQRFCKPKVGSSILSTGTSRSKTLPPAGVRVDPERDVLDTVRPAGDAIGTPIIPVIERSGNLRTAVGRLPAVELRTHRDFGTTKRYRSA